MDRVTRVFSPARPGPPRVDRASNDPSTEDDLATAQRVIAELTELVNSSTSLASQHEAEAAAHAHDAAQLRAQLADLKKQRDDALFVADELRAAIFAEQRSADAKVARATSQAAEERAASQARADSLAATVAERDREVAEMQYHLQASQRRLDEAERTAATAVEGRAAAEKLIEERAKSHELQHAAQLKREAELEQHIAILLDRAEALRKAIDAARTEAEEQKVKVTHLNDVNRVLAVRLKAATAESEAHQMEVEARQMLQRQNDEMEKQIQELRRAIASMMHIPRR